MQAIKAKVYAWWVRVTTLVVRLWQRGRHLLPSRKPRVRVYLPHAFANDPRTRVAVHEAGHAVVSHASRCVTKILMITVHKEEFEDGGQKIDGLVLTEHTRTKPSPQDCWEYVSIALAGLAAEALAYGYFMSNSAEIDLGVARVFIKKIIAQESTSARQCPWNLDTSDAPSIDFTKCVDHMFDRDISPQEANILNLCYARAQALVRKHHRVLDALATILEKKDRVSGREAEKILAH